MESLLFDSDLIGRYDASGPRYTSYPTAPQMQAGFGEAEYRTFAARTNEQRPTRPLSLYVHLPFCGTICFYCACNKVVTKNRARAAPYLAALAREIGMQGKLYDRERVVEQLHWGGGTPTFISHDEMRALMRRIRAAFSLRDDDRGEYSIEIDPREVRPGTLPLLRELGFNRMSLGVQDVEPRVQRAVNRIQSEELTFAVLEEARALGFRSINLDLIYGLPFQTQESFARTLDKVVAVRPDRLSIFSYAHLPEMFPPQRRIRIEDLPAPADKLAILGHTVARLTAAGYVYIGMDHFALASDELAHAQREGTLYRNFQGYSTHADCDLVGLGVTAIGKVGDSYSQNERTIDAYATAIEAGRLPILRGIALDDDDRLRREVIMSLICRFELDIPAVEARFSIDFPAYFASELERLRAMAQDGLLDIDARGIQVRPAGRLLIRAICMVFDRYLAVRAAAHYSKVI